MTEKEVAKRAREFSVYYKDRGDEKRYTASFWISLLGDVLGVPGPAQSDGFLRLRSGYDGGGVCLTAVQDV